MKTERIGRVNDIDLANRLISVLEDDVEVQYGGKIFWMIMFFVCNALLIFFVAYAIWGK